MVRQFDNTFRIVVAGGGTAGWLSALWMRREFPRCQITVIDSSEIGIIGAGEGTTPPVTAFFRDLGIRDSELIRHCQATLKLGIKFQGWHQDPHSSYYHAFVEKDQFNFYQDVAQNSGRPLFAFDDALDHRHKRLLDFCMDNHCSNMVPDLEDDSSNQDPVSRFRALTTHAMHFDTFMLNRFLRYQGTALHNIYRVDGIIQSWQHDEQGNIVSLQLDTGDSIGCDFVIDCTGLRRLLISSWQDNSWISYSDLLPVDRAVGFQQPSTDDLACYTTARAMPAGWCWNIPIQSAQRCGYVYSSQHLSDDQAIEQIIAEHGTDITMGKQFRFAAGHINQGWHHNCVAMGLANSFIEPLEATSIWQTTMALRSFSQKLPAVLQGVDYYRDLYNREVKADIEEIRDFVFFHYVTHKTDNEFWQHFHDRMVWPDRVREIVEAAESGYLPNWNDRIWGQRFGMGSWWEVGKGQGHFDAQRAKQLVQDLTHTREGTQHARAWSDFQTRTAMATSCLVPHADYLKFVREH